MESVIKSWRRLILASTAGVLWTPLMAQAQVVPSQVAPSPDGQEILVTAQSRGQKLSKTPLSITSLGSSQIQSLGIKQTGDITSAVPNIRYYDAYGGGAPVFSLRGTSSADPSPNVASPVGVLVDGVYKGNLLFQSVPLFDLERLEVLRGPQGVLYGRNTSGGVVSFVSKAPDLTQADAALTLGYASFARKEATASGGIPLIDGVLAARLAFTAVEDHGFVENLLPGYKNQDQTRYAALRGELRFAPTPSVDATLSYSRSRSSGRGMGPWVDEIGAGGIGGYTNDFSNESFKYAQTANGTVGRNRIDNDTVNLQASYLFDGGSKISSITAYNVGYLYSDQDADGSPYQVIRGIVLDKARSYSQDIRISTPANAPLGITAGAFAYRETDDGGNVNRYFYDLPSDRNGNGINDCLDDRINCGRQHNSYKYVRTEFAGFMQASYQLTSRLKVNAGVRYTHETVKVDEYRASLGYLDATSGQEVADAYTTIPAPLDPKKSANVVSYDVTVDYQLRPDIFVYAGYSTGFRGLALNTNGFMAPSEANFARPEKAGTWEAGIKTSWFDHRLKLNLAGFYNNYRDLQFLDITADQRQIIVNAPKATIYGGEAELSANPTSAVSLSAGLGLVHSRYDSLTLSGIDLSGKRLIQAPPVTANIAVDWTVLNHEGAKVSLHGDANYTGKQFYQAFNQPDISQKGFSLVNARIIFDMIPHHVSVSIYSKNILDKHYTIDRIPIFNYRFSQYGMPRTIGVELNYHFR